MTQEDVDDGRLRAQLGAEILVRRRLARRSTRRLAELAGVSEAIIQGLEGAYLAMPSIRVLRWISAALGCRIEIRFVKREPEMTM